MAIGAEQSVRPCSKPESKYKYKKPCFKTVKYLDPGHSFNEYCQYSGFAPLDIVIANTVLQWNDGSQEFLLDIAFGTGCAIAEYIKKEADKPDQFCQYLSCYFAADQNKGFYSERDLFVKGKVAGSDCKSGHNPQYKALCSVDENYLDYRDYFNAAIKEPPVVAKWLEEKQKEIQKNEQVPLLPTKIIEMESSRLVQNPKA